jgi:hypothetical protein
MGNRPTTITTIIMFPGRTFSLLKKQLVKSLACNPKTGRGPCICANRIKNIPSNQAGFNDIIDLCQDYGLSGHGPWCPSGSSGVAEARMCSSGVRAANF